MSTRSTSSNLFSPLRDPESLIRRRNLGEPSSLFDFEEVMSIPHNNQGPPPAGPPPPQNNNGPPLVGLPGDDANRHIDRFLEITQYMKQNGVSDDALCLSLFPYSLTHHATACFADALLYILKFASTFKSLFSNKENLFELENTPLTENCSVVLLKKLLEKLGDPGRFLILCDFQGVESCMALDNLAGIAEDVFVQVEKFTFPADFVFVDYDVNPHVLLILGRPFLRTARALVDVHEEELILRDGDEQLTFHADSTSKHPHKHGNESINMINFINITCKDRLLEVLKFKKSNHPSSGSTTPLSDSSPSLTRYETRDYLLEEFADELVLLDPIPSGKEDNNFDFEADLREIEFSLNQDRSNKSNIETINPILEKFLIVEAQIVESNNLLLDNDSTLPEESSEIASLSSSPFGNKDNVFNPGIHNLGRTQILNDESKDKDLTLKDRDFLSISSDQELILFLELTVIETLLSFSSKNEDKVFNPGILISNGVHSFILELSHRTY
nr:hypothetical protein [Tanacetum cinerariifolium]